VKRERAKKGEIEQFRSIKKIIFFIVKERMLLQLKVSAPENYTLKKNPLQVFGLVVPF